MGFVRTHPMLYGVLGCRLSANPPRKAEPQRGGEFAPLVLLDDRGFIRDLDHGSLVRYVIP